MMRSLISVGILSRDTVSCSVQGELGTSGSRVMDSSSTALTRIEAAVAMANIIYNCKIVR